MKNIIMNDINLKKNICLHCLVKHSLNFVCIKVYLNVNFVILCKLDANVKLIIIERYLKFII